MVSLKLSQGAKPGIGGVLPGAKVTREIADARGVPAGEKCVSPSYHRVFSTPRELVLFVARMRELAGGKPAGFKLCLGSRIDFLAICKAMLAEGVTPDFVVVDGGEGGTGAAPLEYEDHIGTPLTEGLMTVHNALVGVGLRDRVKVGASGKVATGIDIVKRMVQGADYTNSARAMMMAVGCIQAQTCHTNTCPVGVATQDPKRMRALDVGDKSQRVFHYQRQTVAQAGQVLASMGLTGADQLRPSMLRRRVDHERVLSYADMFDHLAPGELLRQRPSWLAAPTGSSPTPTRSEPEESHEQAHHRRPDHRRPGRPRRAPGLGGRRGRAQPRDRRDQAGGPDRVDRRAARGGGGLRCERAGPAHRRPRGLHGHGRPGCDPPAQRAVRRPQVARSGPGDLWAGAAGGDRHRLLPGGRQRPAVRRRGVLQPDDHLGRADPGVARGGGQRGARRAGRRRAQHPGGRGWPAPAQGHGDSAVRARRSARGSRGRRDPRRGEGPDRGRAGDPAGRPGRAARTR